MSYLIHVTPRRNLQSIYALGIDPSFSLGQLRVCWFCSPRRRAWAVAHVADRHGISPAEVAVIRVSVLRDQLQAMGRCSWTCKRVVRSLVSVSVPFAA